MILIDNVMQRMLYKMSHAKTHARRVTQDMSYKHSQHLRKPHS